MHKIPIPGKDEYFVLAKDELDIDFRSEECEETYRWNVTNVHAATKTVFGGKLGELLEKCEKQYSKRYSKEDEEKETVLLMAPSELNITWDEKKYASVLDKVYRYNVVENLAWPSEPSDGWMKPENWFSRLYDTVRTRIVCKYIDGPKFLAEQLYALAKDLKLESEFSSRQKDDGYYAYHFYSKIPARILIGAKLERVKVAVEIQITTQLQDVLNQITHLYYEEKRIRRESDPSSWKWDFDDNRFRVGYLSHTLHLLEAIILEARTRSLKSAKR